MRPDTRIFWQIQGLVSDSDQRSITKEALRQLQRLQNRMSFQNLNQGSSRVIVNGIRFTCTSVYNCNKIYVELAKVAGGGAKVGFKDCFCTCQFSVGVILEVFPVDSFPGNCYPILSNEYPECTEGEDGASKYMGIRYLVKVCQCNKHIGAKWLEVICASTDFEVYEVDDKAVVLLLDTWDPEECNLDACSLSPRDKSEDTKLNTIDGQFVILPYEITELL